MIVMLDTPTCLDECAAELGGAEVEQLFTPLTRYKPQRPEQNFAIDNGAFSNFDAQLFRNLLRRHEPRKSLCRFVSVPDVVGSARRTVEVFEIWKDDPVLAGWPLALVCQNGQEDIPVPWRDVAAVFIGGDTEWKMGPHAATCIKAALALGKWVHVGRVNTPGRLEYFERLGAHSIDGTGLARYTHMREAVARAATEPELSYES